MPVNIKLIYHTAEGQAFAVENAIYAIQTSRGCGVLHSLKIDKIAMVFDIPPKRRKEIVEKLEASVFSLKYPLKVGKAIKMGIYLHAYKITLPDSPETLNLSLSPKKQANAQRYGRIEFNPHRLGKDGIAAMFGALESHIGKELSLKSLQKTAKVTIIDVTLDIQNIHMNDLLLDKSDSHKTHAYFSASGRMETFYAGIRINQKNGDILLYNKGKEVKEKSLKPNFKPGPYKDLPLDIPFTRLEVTKRPNLTLGALAGMENPFTKLNLYFVRDVKGPEGSRQWTWFVDSCRIRGIEGALKTLPEPLKAEYLKALQAQPEQLYRPDTIWKSWAKSLKASGLVV